MTPDTAQNTPLKRDADTQSHSEIRTHRSATSALRRHAVCVTLCLNAVAPLLLIMTALTEPEIGRSLGIPASEDVWLAEALIAAQISLTPLCGFLLARFGAVSLLRLRAFGTVVTSAIGVSIGFVDSLRSLPLLAGALFLQGACTAPLTPATQVLIVASHGENERARGMAVWSAARYMGFLAGSLLAGWVAQSLAWPVIFLIAPLLAAGSLLWLRADIDTGKSANAPIDWRGFALLLTTMIALQVLLNLDRPAGWLTTVLLGAAVMTLAGMLLLTRHLRRAASPIVSLQPLRNRWFATAAGLSFGVNIFTTGQFEILLLDALHVSPEILGLRSAAGGLAQIAGVVIAGCWLHRERLLVFLLCATAFLLLGLYGYTWYEPQVSYAVVLWTRMASGFGMGLCTAALSVAAFDSLPATQSGQAASLLALASTLGTALGLAGLNAIFTGLAHARLASEFGAYTIVFWVQFFSVALLSPLLLTFRTRSPSVKPQVVTREIDTALL